MRIIFIAFLAFIHLKAYTQVKADFSFSDSLCGTLDVKFNNKSSNAGTFFWYFSPGTSSAANPTKTFPAYGNYDVTLIAFGNASLSDTITKTVHIFPKPNTTISGTQSVLCAGEVGFLNATYNSRYKYLWSPSKWLSDTLISNPQSTALITTRYFLSVIDTVSNCYDTSSFLIKVKSCKPPIAGYVYDKPECGSYDVAFYNISINKYQSSWQFDDGSSILYDNRDTIMHTYAVAGTYTVLLTVFDSLGLYIDTFSMQVQIGDKVTASILTPDSQICRGDSVLLVGNGGVSPLRWSPSIWLSDSVGNNIYASPKATTIYDLIVEDNGCFDTAKVTITVTEFPPLKIYADSPCLGQPLQIWATPKAISGSIYEWDWLNGTTTLGSKVQHLFNDTGIHALQLKYTTDGCDTTIDKEVKIFPLPTALFDQNPTDVFVEQPVVQFYNRSQFATRYRWDFGDGVYTYDTSVSHQYLDTGTFTVQMVAFNEFGCTDTAWSKFTIRPELILFIPNAFTPNKNGPVVNEKFKIFLNQTLPEFEFTIFNKWGERVFETTDQNFEWDGDFRGEPCLTNSYFWTMRYRVSQEKVKYQKGILYLYK